LVPLTLPAGTAFDTVTPVTCELVVDAIGNPADPPPPTSVAVFGAV